MNSLRVRGQQHVQSRPEAIGYGPAVKFGNELARINIDVVDGADIAVVDLLVVIVLFALVHIHTETMRRVNGKRKRGDVAPP
jgi:hypothetical protein